MTIQNRSSKLTAASLVLLASAFAHGQVIELPEVPTASIETTIAPPASFKAPVIEAKTYSESDADLLLHRENSLGFTVSRAKRGLKSYSVKSTQIDGRASWIHYGGNTLVIGADLRPSREFSVSGNAGAGHLVLEEYLGQSRGTAKSIPVWDVDATYSPTASTDLTIGGTENFAYMNWVDEGGEGRVMEVKQARTVLETRGDWNYRTLALMNFYADGDEQQWIDNELLRQVVTAPFDLRAGVGGGMTKHTRQSLEYPSPEYRDFYSVRAAVSKELSPSWKIESKFRYGFRQNRGVPKDREIRTDLAVEYKAEDGWMAKLAGCAYDLGEGRWWRNDLGLSLEIPF